MIFADDRVLHGVGDGQQHHQVERVELRQLAFARQPQADNEEDVYHDGPDDLLREGQTEDEHVGDKLGVHGSMLAEAGRFVRVKRYNSASHAASGVSPL